MSDPLLKKIAEEAWGVDLDDKTMSHADRAFLRNSAREIVRIVRDALRGES